MPTQMKIDDEVRIKILEALFKKGAIQPNVRQIKKETGLHTATIKSSLDFLKKEDVLTGYGPKVDFGKFGYQLEARAIVSVDNKNKKAYNEFKEKMLKDPNLFQSSEILGSGNWNLYISHLYENVESFHKGMKEKYYDSIDEIYDVIKDKLMFFATEPHLKMVSRTKAVISLIKQKKGYDF